MSENIQTRISEVEYKIIMSICEQYNITRGKFLKIIIRNELKNCFKDGKLRINQKYIKEFEKLKQLVNIKARNHDLYLIRNCQRTLYMIGTSLMFNSGDIDMKIINEIIDQYIKLYDTFDAKSKELLKFEVDEINKLKNKNRFLERFKKVSFLE